MQSVFKRAAMVQLTILPTMVEPLFLRYFSWAVTEMFQAEEIQASFLGFQIALIPGDKHITFGTSGRLGKAKKCVLVFLLLDLVIWYFGAVRVSFQIAAGRQSSTFRSNCVAFSIQPHSISSNMVRLMACLPCCIPGPNCCPFPKPSQNYPHPYTSSFAVVHPSPSIRFSLSRLLILYLQLRLLSTIC